MNIMAREASLGASAFCGAIVAVLADLMQKDQASAVLTISNMVEVAFRMPFSPLLAALLLVVLGIAMCFIFGADTNKNAFYVGASVLSAIMIATPYHTPGTLRTDPGRGAAGPAVHGGWWDPAVAYAQPRATSALVQVSVTLRPADNKPISNVALTLRDSAQRIVGRSVLSGDRITFYEAPGDYTLSVVADGYQIETRRLVLTGRPLSVAVALRPTWLPTFVQRIAP